jgi:hypothetical protein
MIGIHQRSQRLPISTFNGISRISSDFPHLIEYYFPVGFVGFPEFSHVADGFSCRCRDAGIADDDAERRADVEGLNRLAFDEINRSGVCDDGIVDAGGRAMMQFFDFVSEAADLLIR